MLHSWFYVYIKLPAAGRKGSSLFTVELNGEKFNLRNLNELEVKEKYQIEITNRFAALENLNVEEDVNRT